MVVASDISMTIMISLILCLVLSALLESTAFLTATDAGALSTQLNGLTQAMTGLQTNIKSSDVFLQALGGKVQNMEKSLFIVQAEQKAYETRNGEALKKMDVTIKGQATLLQTLVASIQKQAALQKILDTTIKQHDIRLKKQDVKVAYSPASHHTGSWVLAHCPTGYLLLACSVLAVDHSDGPFVGVASGNSDPIHLNKGFCGMKPNTLAASGKILPMARAVCGPASEVGDIKYQSSWGWTSNPTDTCQAGYTLIDCTVMTEHGEQYVNEDFPGGVANGNTCKSDRTCRADSGCRINAICQKI